MAGALLDEESEGGTGWRAVMAEVLMISSSPPFDPSCGYPRCASCDLWLEFMCGLGPAPKLIDGGGPCGSCSRPPRCVAAAVAQHAFLPATVRVAVVSKLTKLRVHAPASICKRVIALLKIMRRLMAIWAVSLTFNKGCRVGCW